MYHNTNYALCQLINRVRLNLITFGHAEVSTEWNGTVSAPVYSRLYYISCGTATIVTESGQSVLLEAGNWYLLPTGCSFRYACTVQMEHFYFHLKLCDFEGMDLLRKCEKPLCISLEQDESENMLKCLHTQNMLHGLSLQQTAFSVLLAMLDFHKINIEPEIYSQGVKRAIQYIREHLSVQLTISEIAENLFISKSTLTKHFRKELSMSVSDYIYGLVMSNAEYMLTAGNSSIQEISEKFGFCDQFYFSKKFKEKFGQSPREYRKHRLL